MRGGPVLRHLGGKLVDELTSATLREWWNLEIVNTKRSDAASESTMSVWLPGKKKGRTGEFRPATYGRNFRRERYASFKPR